MIDIDQFHHKDTRTQNQIVSQSPNSERSACQANRSTKAGLVGDLVWFRGSFWFNPQERHETKPRHYSKLLGRFVFLVPCGLEFSSAESLCRRLCECAVAGPDRDECLCRARSG